MTDPVIAQLLQSSGFEPNEASVYLALLEFGSATASEVADKSGLKRALVYHHLDNLIKKGYVSELFNKKVRRFVAAEPVTIVQHLKVLTENLQFFLPVMRALQNKGRSRPRVELFEGKEAIIKVFRAHELGKELRFISSIQRLAEYFPEEVEGWIERYGNGSISAISRSLLTDSVADREWGRKAKKAGQLVRIMPKHIELALDFSIVDDTVSIVSFEPLFIVVITSAPIATSIAQLFDLVWQNSKK